MTEGEPLQLQADFFGAEEALTNYIPGQDPWVATLIFCGANRRQAWENRTRSIDVIVKQFGIEKVMDSDPNF